MPILATNENLDQLSKMADNHVCAVCGAFLTIGRMSGGRDTYLMCSKFEKHNGVRRLDKDYALINLLRLKKGEPMVMQSTALQKLDDKGMLARVNQAKWPKELTPADKTIIVTVSREYGLDPLFNELMVYQGRPYVTIDARRRKAQESGNLDGITSRPATDEERTARQVKEKDYLFYCEVRVKGSGFPFVGWGHVREKETKGSDFLPIVNDPMFMAEKRAEAQALRRAFHIPLPSAEDFIEGEASIIQASVEGDTVKKTLPPPPPKEKTATGADHPTQAQINKLWTAAKEQNMQASQVNAHIKEAYGVDSAKDLTVSQMASVIKWVETGEKDAGNTE